MGKGLLGLIMGRKGKVEPVAAPVKVIEHSANCKLAQAAYAAWSKENPYHCQHCHGTGIKSASTDHDTGCYDIVPCEHCADLGKCPVCGIEQAEDWDGEKCVACGWDIDDDRTHAPWYDCECAYEGFEEPDYSGFDSVQFFVGGDFPGAGEEGEALGFDDTTSDFWYDCYRDRGATRR